MRSYTMSETEWLKVFANNLASILKDFNMTQRELADLSGISESTISKYINKQQIPSLKAIINIAHALDVDIDSFIDFGYDII